MKIVDMSVNKFVLLLLLVLLLTGCSLKKNEEITCVASTGDLGGNYASSTSSLNYKFEKGHLSRIIMTMDISFSENSTLKDSEKEASIRELLTDYYSLEHMDASYRRVDSNHYVIDLDVDYKNLTDEELKSFTYTKEQTTDIDYLARSYEAQGYKCE